MLRCATLCSCAVSVTIDPSLHTNFQTHLLQELLTVFVTVGHGVDLEGLAKHMCQADVDGPIVHFLRAVTAAELCEKEEHYKTFIPGIDAYG